VYQREDFFLRTVSHAAIRSKKKSHTFKTLFNFFNMFFLLLFSIIHIENLKPLTVTPSESFSKTPIIQISYRNIFWGNYLSNQSMDIHHRRYYLNVLEAIASMKKNMSGVIINDFIEILKSIINQIG